MRRRQWIARLTVATAIGLAGSIAGAAVAAPTVKGDTAAYEEIIAEGGRAGTLDYDDYGANITITLPC